MEVIAMKIGEVCKATGISRRNIHFYIKEGLISPASDESNGYYDFSEEDCMRLILIRELRKADYPVSVIQAILDNPRTAHYYYRIHINTLRSRLRYYSDIVEDLSELVRDMPLRPTLADLTQAIAGKKLPDPPEKVTYADSSPDYDNQLVNHFLWREFLPDDLTEYQKYLLEKINMLTVDPAENPDYLAIYTYLSSLDRKEIDRQYAVRVNRYSEIIDLQPDQLEAYSESLKHNLEMFLGSDQLIQVWKDMYSSYLYPDVRIYTSAVGDLAREMSPLLKRYTENINTITGLVYEWLHSPEGAQLLTDMDSKLHGYYNIDHAMHGELEAMETMVKS